MRNLQPTRSQEVLREQSYTNVLDLIVNSLNDSHDTLMYGNSYRRGEVVVVNGQIALACCVVLLVAEFDGFGILRTMSGQRSFPNINNDGFMLMHVKKLGTHRDFTLKAGTGRLLTA